MELSGFEQYLTNLDCAKLTTQAYCKDMSMFARWFEQTNGQELMPQNLTSTDVREYKQYLLIQQQARPATINRRLASIRMYVRWAMDSNQLSYNPISGVKSVAEQKLAPKWLSRLEQAALIREAEKNILASHTETRRLEAIRDRSILILMSNTGVRLQELISLDIHDIQMTERKGMLTVRCGKGMKTRVIPLNNTARTAIKEWLQIRPECGSEKLFTGMKGDLKQRAVQEIFKNLGEKAHVHFTPHSLRHTFAKNLIDTSQVSLDKVGILLGHASLNSTKIYTTPSDKDLTDSVNFLDN
jgi:site-specific recombinase XerD